MMKKTLLLASVIAFTMTTSAYAATTETTTQKAVAPAQVQTAKPADMQKPPKRPDFQKKHNEFEKRLKLTDKQKEQAKQIRIKGHEQMKPVMEQIKAKHQEADAVRKSRIAPKMQEEKLQKINMELRELRKQAHEIRTQNMKEFESILTKKQKKELEKMKKEGRERFEREHRPHPGGPGFGPKPEGPCPQPPKAE